MKHEENKLIRVGRDLLESMNIEENKNLKPRFLSKTYVREVLAETETETFENKPLQGYFRTKIIENENLDQKLS